MVEVVVLQENRGDMGSEKGSFFFLFFVNKTRYES